MINGAQCCCPSLLIMDANDCRVLIVRPGRTSFWGSSRLIFSGFRCASSFNVPLLAPLSLRQQAGWLQVARDDVALRRRREKKDGTGEIRDRASTMSSTLNREMAPEGRAAGLEKGVGWGCRTGRKRSRRLEDRKVGRERSGNPGDDLLRRTHSRPLGPLSGPSSSAEGYALMPPPI